MKTFTLWAPDATRVDVVIGPERFPMRKINDGWWSAEIPSAGPGTDYAFILDGGEPLPDPRYADFGTLADLAKALERVFIYDGRYSAFRRRRRGRPPAGLSGGVSLAICKPMIRSAIGPRESAAII